MSSISQLYNNIASLVNQNFSRKEDVQNSISSHNNDNTAHSSEMAKKVDTNQGSSNANKNVVTDSSGNITIEDKPTIPTRTSELTNDSNYINTNDSRLTDSRTPKSHTHGNITDEGKIGSASGKIITTGTNGVIQASDSITKSMISDFPTSMAPTSHNHTTGEVTDTSAYTNIGSAANSTQKTINNNINTVLGNKANTDNVYTKNETYTQSEITSAISNAVSNLQLFEVVETLPTTNIKNNRLYLIVNGESIAENNYDIYLRVNNKWEKLDSLDFDISNFYNKTETDTLLSSKVDTTDSRLSDSRTPKSHSHGDITNTGAIGTTANKPLITTTNGKIATGSFGTSANTFCQGNDSRLSDARTPLSHDHDFADIDFNDGNFWASLLETDYDSFVGAIGIAYNYNVDEMHFPTNNIYDGDGFQLATLNDIPSTSNFIQKGSSTNILLANGNTISQYSTATTSANGLMSSTDKTNLNNLVSSTATTKNAHTHTKSQITDFPTIPSKTSELTNDSGFLTSVPSHTHTSSQITDNQGPYYGTCSTAAGTRAKVVSCSNFVLATGEVIHVKFTNAQTYNGTVTLNVNSKGAKTVTNSANGSWKAGETVGFMYDGSTFYQLGRYSNGSLTIY